MIKLIVSDLDGTLIPEGTQDFEPGFFEALEELLDRGYDFYAASGRQYVNMHAKLEKYADRIGFLADNGAIVMKNNRCLFLEEIPRKFVLEVAEYAQNMEAADILISGAEDTYFFPKTKWFKNHILNVYGLPAKMPNQLTDITEPIIKLSINIYDYEKNVKTVQQRLKDRFGQWAQFVPTGNTWIDMILYDTGKGKALREVMKLKGLKPEEVMTFGDNFNDISMLQITPNSYAKSNSCDEVKAAASHVCDSVIDVWRETLLSSSMPLKQPL